MAYMRSPENDLACLTLMVKNPITYEEYYKDFYFLPKYYDYQKIEDGKTIIERLDMIKYKSKYDTNINYDEKNKKYGYTKYVEDGHVVIVNEELINKLVELFGESAYCDCAGITEHFIAYYIVYLQTIYNFTIYKIGLDPNKASKVESMMNNISGHDEYPLVVKFYMEKHTRSNFIMESTKDIRAQGLVYCKNKLTELHFANAHVKHTNNGIILVNPARSRKDGVIAHLAARTAYHVFTTNYKWGAKNLELLVNHWSDLNNENNNSEWSAG